jgi:hypothetical protein
VAARWGCLALLVPLAVWQIRPGTALLLLGAPFLIYLLLRLVTATLVRGSMMREAGKVQEASAASDVPAASPGPPPESSLRFQELDETVDLRLTPGQRAHLKQMFETGRETWHIVRRSILVSFAGLAAAGAGWSFFLPAGDKQTLWLLGLALAFQVGFLALLARGTFASVGRVPAGFLVISSAIAALPAPWLFPPAGLPSLGYVLAIAAGVALTVRGYRRLSRRLRRLGDHPLLILRVFGSDSQTAFVFGEVMRRWRFLGSFATIADPSYVRYQGSLASRENRRYLAMFTWVYLAWIGTVSFLAWLLLQFRPSPQVSAIGNALGWRGSAELAGIATGALLIPLFLALVLVLVRRNFVHTLARLAQGPGVPARAVAAGGVFRRIVLFCYDDVWKSAVSSLLPTSQAVLMDVRGFTPERRGCEYELGLLIDRFPVDRIVLLIDDGPNKDLLFSILRERWSRMSPESPNRTLQDPVLTSYAPGMEDPGDVTRILALLTGVLPTSPEADGAADPAALSIPGEKTRQMPSPGWGEHLGRLDLALSAPAVARVVIPVILAAMVLYAYSHVAPVAAAYRAFSTPSIQRVAILAETRPPLPSASPGAPFTVTAHVWPNEPIFGGNKNKPYDSLTIGIHLKGGPLSGALRATGLSDVVAIGPDGQRLETGDIERTFPGDRDEPPVPGEQRFYIWLTPLKTIDRIASLSAQVTQEVVPPEQRIVTPRLDELVPGPGWVRLSHPRLDGLSRIELVRFSADDGIQIRQKGNRKQLQTALFHADGTEVTGTVDLRKGDELRRNVFLRDVASGARLEIPLIPARLERVGFKVEGLPVRGGQ